MPFSRAFLNPLRLCFLAIVVSEAQINSAKILYRFQCVLHWQMFPLGILWPVVVTHEIIHHHDVPFCFLLCQDYGDYLFHSVWWHCPPKDSSCNLISAVCLGKSVILSLLNPGSESLHRPATSLEEPLWLTIWGNFRSEQPFPLTWPNRTQMGRFTSFSWCLRDRRAASIMASGEPSAWVLTVIKDRLYSLPRTPRSWGTKMRLMCGTVHSLGKPNSPKMNYSDSHKKS